MFFLSIFKTKSPENNCWLWGLRSAAPRRGPGGRRWDPRRCPQPRSEAAAPWCGRRRAGQTAATAPWASPTGGRRRPDQAAPRGRRPASALCRRATVPEAAVCSWPAASPPGSLGAAPTSLPVQSNRRTQYIKLKQPINNLSPLPKTFSIKELWKWNTVTYPY